ncbi:universal stress protein [Roseateles sp. DAIF2]|uniref:universal stress protein n=1 Tax=Roseateles sp. DAIF2 TaxID=2714952 RepID=UPI0018A30981|nr:universal stress protein [Roseateles sp. DAIF2]QPF75937.1 universal stress protein [Roseateles sp. DAIF2]
MHTILTLNDFSSAAEQALARAVLLARRHDAVLELAHLDGTGPPDVGERLQRCAAMLARRHRLRVRCLGVLDGETQLREILRARSIDLLVLGWPEEQRHAWLFTPLARRLLRRQPCPLLVVRRPAERAYAKLLVAVELMAPQRALRLVEAAAALQPEAQLELFHAIGTRDEARLRAAEASYRSVLAYREALYRQARQHLLQLSDSLGARRNRLMYTLGRGDPARQTLVQQEHGGAELIVVGLRPPRPAWAGPLLGSTAATLLGRAGCDLLVWPQEQEGAPAPAQAASSPAAKVCSSTQRA